MVSDGRDGTLERREKTRETGRLGDASHVQVAARWWKREGPRRHIDTDGKRRADVAPTYGGGRLLIESSVASFVVGQGAARDLAFAPFERARERLGKAFDVGSRAVQKGKARTQASSLVERHDVP
jgi:hypothetical protein